MIIRTVGPLTADLPSIPMQVAFPPLIPGEDLFISASTFVLWKKCPDQANARLQGIYGPDSRPAFVGSLAHRIFSRHLSSGPIPSEEFIQACKEEIGGSGLNNKMAGLEIRPSALAGVIEEVRALYERFTRFPGEGFEGTEVTLEVELDPGISLLGTVDAVYKETTGRHRLVDWKTGELGEAEYQLDFYALLWALDRNELPATVEAVSVGTGERRVNRPTAAIVSGTASEVGEMANLIRVAWANGHGLERTAGPWCRYCPLLPECSEGQAAEALLD